jgi:Flp pilus assembly protein TadD
MPGASAVPLAAATPLALIDAALAEGRLDAADALIRRAESMAASPALALRRAEWLLATGAEGEAASAFTALTAAEPAGSALGLALLAFRRGRDAEAARLVDTALAHDPALLRAWLLKGALADRARQWTVAEAAAARALALAPGSAAAWNNRGYSRLLQSRAAEAEADFARALALQPGLATASANLRLARALQGRYAAAFDGAAPQELARVLNIVGFGALARGDLAASRGYFARALDQADRHDPRVAQNLAYVEALAAAQR